MGLVQHIAQLVGEDAAVPQGSLPEIGLCRLKVRLFLKGRDRAHQALILRDDVAIFFAGIGGLDPHQHQVGLAFFGQLPQLFDGLKIAVLHIGVHRTDHHRLIGGDVPDVVEVSGGQGDGRKGVPAAGLHGDPYLFAQLVMDGRDLSL